MLLYENPALPLRGIVKLISSFILVDGLTKSISSGESDSSARNVLQKRFPQSHFHSYDPFAKMEDVSIESDIFQEQAHSLLQSIVGCLECSRIHRGCQELGGPPFKERPIIFLAHDLGGSVVKKSLLLAMEDPSCQRAAKATRAIFFFGGLHRANHPDTWEVQVKKLISVSQRDVGSMFGGIQTISMALNSIGEGFYGIMGSYAVFNVYEKTESPVGTTQPPPPFHNLG